MKHHRIVAAFLRKNDRIVLIRQPRASKPDEHIWLLPGGGLEDGEDEIAGARREVKEETGLDALGTPELLYICEYGSEAQGFLCTVRMYAFPDYGGLLSVQDPDAEVLEARAFSHDEALMHLTGLPWPMVRDPICAYLVDGEKPGAYWKYMADGAGIFQLIERKTAKD